MFNNTAKYFNLESESRHEESYSQFSEKTKQKQNNLNVISSNEYPHYIVN